MLGQLLLKEVMTKLGGNLVKIKTYKKPNPNTNINPTRCLLVILIFNRSIAGSITL
jgi:hypothetical protein